MALEAERARAEHHRTAAGTLRTKNTELKKELRECRQRANASAAALEAATHELMRVALPEMPPLECSICLEDLCSDGQERTALPCAHVFHSTCIGQWLQRSHECPVCQTPAR